MSAFLGIPVTFKGPIYSLFCQFIEFISDSTTLSSFHQSLAPSLQKRYVVLLPQMISHFGLSDQFFPMLLSDCMNNSSPQILFLDETPSTQILVNWVAQNINADFISTLKNLLRSLQTRARLTSRSKTSQPSKILEFLNEHPQPPQFWDFFSRFGDMIALKFPGYEQTALGGFFFLRYLCPLITSIGNDSYFHKSIADALRTLALSLYAPNTILQSHDPHRDQMIHLFLKLRGSQVVKLTATNPQFPAFTSMDPTDIIEFFQLIPQVAAKFQAKLKKQKQPLLDKKWLYLMLEWSAQVDNIMGMSPRRRQFSLLFPTNPLKTKRGLSRSRSTGRLVFPSATIDVSTSCQSIPTEDMTVSSALVEVSSTNLRHSRMKRSASVSQPANSSALVRPQWPRLKRLNTNTILTSKRWGQQQEQLTPSSSSSSSSSWVSDNLDSSDDSEATEVEVVITAHDTLLWRSVELKKPTHFPIVTLSMETILQWMPCDVIKWLTINSLGDLIPLFSQHQVTGNDLLSGHLPSLDEFHPSVAEQLQNAVAQLRRGTHDLFDPSQYVDQEEHILALQAALIKMASLVKY